MAAHPSERTSMKRFAFSFLLAAACLAGCNEPQPARIEFSGHAPFYSKDPDERQVRAYCPHCGERIAWMTKKCPNKKCEGEITWPETVRCDFCRGTGVCEVCTANRRTDFKCFQCEGRRWSRFYKPCPHCEGAGVCPLCKGKGKCDYCEGGQYSVEKKKGVIDPGAEPVAAEKTEEADKGKGEQAKPSEGEAGKKDAGAEKKAEGAPAEGEKKEK